MAHGRPCSRRISTSPPPVSRHAQRPAPLLDPSRPPHRLFLNESGRLLRRATSGYGSASLCVLWSLCWLWHFVTACPLCRDRHPLDASRLSFNSPGGPLRRIIREIGMKLRLATKKVGWLCSARWVSAKIIWHVYAGKSGISGWRELDMPQRREAVLGHVILPNSLGPDFLNTAPSRY